MSQATGIDYTVPEGTDGMGTPGRVAMMRAAATAAAEQARRN